MNGHQPSATRLVKRGWVSVWADPRDITLGPRWPGGAVVLCLLVIQVEIRWRPPAPVVVQMTRDSAPVIDPAWRRAVAFQRHQARHGLPAPR